MFCKNCGNQISENAQFCSKCGTMVTPVASSESTPKEVVPEFPGNEFTANQFTANEFTTNVNESAFDALNTPVSSQPPKKKGKKILIISIISAVIVAAVAAVIIILNSVGAFGGKSNGEAEVKAYLDYIAKKNDDVGDYISDAYVGGLFGQLYSGEKADDLYEAMTKADFEKCVESDMGFSIGATSADYTDYDNWEEFAQEVIVEYFYDAMEDAYGDWSMSYKITDNAELSDSDIEDIEEKWDAVVEYYESTADEYDDDVAEKIEDFVKDIEDLKIKKAYEIEVEVEIEGEDDSYSEDYEFTVAKVGDEWVILEGPSYYEFSRMK